MMLMMPRMALEAVWLWYSCGAVKRYGRFKMNRTRIVKLNLFQLLQE